MKTSTYGCLIDSVVRHQLFMATTRGFKRPFPFIILMGLILIHSGSGPVCLNAQSQGSAANARIASSDQAGYSRVVLAPISPPAPLLPPRVSGTGAGLTTRPQLTPHIAPALQTRCV